MFQVITTLLFYAIIAPATVLFSILGGITLITPSYVRYYIVTGWSRLFIFLARVILGIDYQITGIHNIPKTPCVVVANHQSLWETLFMQVLLPRQCLILKRELLRIPFFGWGLRSLQPIAIDRSKKMAVKTILDTGVKRLQNGIWVIIFPQGTRVAPDQHKNFSRTAAALAIAANAPMLLIAHNSGSVWPKGLLPKKRGIINVTIAKPTNPQGYTASQLTTLAQQWIIKHANR